MQKKQDSQKETENIQFGGKRSRARLLLQPRHILKLTTTLRSLLPVMRGLLFTSGVAGKISFKERPHPVKLPSCENFLLLDNICIKSYLSLSFFFLPTYFLSSHIIYTNIKRALNVILHFCFCYCFFVCLFVKFFQKVSAQLLGSTTPLKVTLLQHFCSLIPCFGSFISLISDLQAHFGGVLCGSNCRFQEVFTHTTWNHLDNIRRNYLNQTIS